MFWQESKENEQFVVPDDIVDVVFGIRCRTLTVDHAHDLSIAIRAVLPWLEDEPVAGVHSIHVADSGNGWMRPEDPDALLHLSRRTKLMLRLPKQRIADADLLTGHTLKIGGHDMLVERAVVKPLTPITTVFSRYVVVGDTLDETGFLKRAQTLLGNLGIQAKKMMCGIERTIRMPAGSLRTRSLMLADLTLDQSILLQQQGLGSERLLGCGLFLPHKDINEVRPVLD